MPDNQNVSIWDNPMYAWQQQLASGANLAKNLNWQTLLGLTLGTGIGHWLGDKFYNWQRAGDDTRQYGKPNPNYNPQSPLWQRGGDFNLGWKPQYPFPTANKLFTDRVTPNPSSWDWRQNNRRPQPFFPMTQTTTPQVPATPTQPALATPTTETTGEPPQTPIPQYPSPTIAKSIYDDWRLNHENNRQHWVDRPFS